MTKLFLTFLLLVIFSTSVKAQSSIENTNSIKPFISTETQKKASDLQSPILNDVVITGTVLDKETKDPLEYATISFFDKRKNKIETGGITDVNGNFSIPVMS